MTSGLIICIAIIVAAIVFFRRGLSTNKSSYIVPANTQQLLANNVAFYGNLDEEKKKLFEARVKDFLQHVVIKGVDVVVEDLDRILVAAGAIIPIFGFPCWKYTNLDEVLLYKGNFNKSYQTDGQGRDVLGMVGDGALHREMLLSQPSLRLSFQNATDGHNTAIHEFMHLIDKADGATDGVPEYMMAHPDIGPWIARMRETIQEMREKNKSDIDLYGATNDAEFFAVVSEYFFEKPHQLQEKHPELYSMLEAMFNPGIEAQKKS